MGTTRRRRTSGLTLLEVLIAVAIGALLVAGAASHLRTLRQTRDVATARREALQSARIALDRIARHIRGAREVHAIKFDDVKPEYKLELKDFNDDDHKFENDIGNAELKYNGKVLAYHTLATFKGHNAEGAVADDKPEDIDAVEVTVTTSIADSTESVTLATFVRLRRNVVGRIRRTTSYAATFSPTTAEGIADDLKALGEPDDDWAKLETSGGGRYEGFARGDYTSAIERISAGWRMEFKKGALRVVIRHGETVLLDTTYSAADLEHVEGEKRWWWLDITSLRPTWTGEDIDDLSIEVRDPEGLETEVKLDCFVIDAFFDPIPSSFLWADREGEGDCPAEWDDATRALGAPNSSSATGEWLDEDWHGFRVATEDSDDEIIAVYVCVNAYVFWLFNFDGDLEVWIAKKDDDLDKGARYTVPEAALTPYWGSWNRGNILVNVTNALDWRWQDLDEYQIRLHLVQMGSGNGWFMADAVGWNVLHVDEDGGGISSWSEQ
ncbi:MAG: prepilin-type N-terminal cleavage/methylation domain-containing protein [Candidatus Brocadiae bacterium]|nr:prepilin-type N-terminal cleavage/methylation domain-containing protein [Candidatus Brocadiia bacterium]